MKRISLSCLALCVTMLSFFPGSLSAEEIKTGYLIIEGKKIDPPFKVEISDGKVLVNGIQTYPHTPSSRETAEEKEKKDAKELLDSLHEEFVKREKLHGHGKAREWLMGELEKPPSHKKHTLRETKMGMEVNLKGMDDVENVPYIRYMREDNAPSREKQLNQIERKIVSHYRDWRKTMGKQMALKMVEKELKGEPLIDEFKLDQQTHAVWLRWKGRPYGGWVGLWPEGYGDILPTETENEQRRIQFQASEIRGPLADGSCVVVFGGSSFSSPHGKTACDAVLQMVRERPAPEEGLPILAVHFYGRTMAKSLWRRLEQYWKSE